MLRGYGCPICKGRGNSERFSKTQEQYIKEVNDKNPNIVVIGKYKNAFMPILHKCKIHNCNWYAKPTNVLKGIGCPDCSPKSKLEIYTENFLNRLCISYKKYKKYDGLVGVGNYSLSYDFYLPDYNILIECQGEQHEHPVEYFGGEEQFKVQQEHDRRKREYAKEHNINLLEIWYYDIDNIENILNETLNNLKLESVETVIPSIAI